MTASTIQGVPTTVVTGFLGVGKTTAILDLLRHRPDGETWAVLVNEFGEVGLDGETLASGGYVVREIAGGCICCSAGPYLRVNLTRLLREARPDRLLIEPTGLAMPGVLSDMLRGPAFRDALSLRASVTLVDASQMLQPSVRDLPAYRAQLEAADVLVANHGDRTPQHVLDQFHEEAGEMWPPKLVVSVTEHGQMDPAWLDLDPGAPRHWNDEHHHAAHLAQGGRVWPPGDVWHRDQLDAWLQDMVQGRGDVAELLRLKGVFRTTSGWVLVNATADRLTAERVSYRRGSAVEVIANSPPASGWEQVWVGLEDCRKAVSKPS